MKKVIVKTSGAYDVLVGSGLLPSAGEIIRGASKASRVAIITDDNVDAIYGEDFEKILQEAGFETIKFVFPHGEESKNGETFLKILSFLAKNQITRGDAVAALGGGVVGDIAGFAAASFLRGIDFIQIPTTLLAAVDSSVGGKTAIDLPQGKNLVGAFYQPKAVMCDYDTLKTLKPEVFTDGCAEVIKYGVLADGAFFDHLLEHGKAFDMEYAISRCVAIKRDFVIADEWDRGLRQLLNLGHTLGHAVEARSGYAVSHGCAVSIGMAVVSRASARAGLCAAATAATIVDILEKFGLPTRTEYSMDELFLPMLSDKKRSGDTVNVIVPKRIGECEILPMKIDELKTFMASGL